MKKIFLMFFINIILVTIVAADIEIDENNDSVWTFEGKSVSEMNKTVKSLFAKDGENIIKVTSDHVSYETYHTVTQDINWEWFTYDEFDLKMKAALEPRKYGYAEFPYGTYGTWIALWISMHIGPERNRDILKQTLHDIKKGIKVAKPLNVVITSDGLPVEFIQYPQTAHNIVGWVNWYAYSYSFKDKSGNEVDLGIYETRDGLFNALRYYCEKEIASGRMTKREAKKFYKGIAHNVRNCDEVPLSDKMINYKKLYNGYRFM